MEHENYSEWQTAEHALSYLARANRLPHRTEGERALLDQIPADATRVLDLGTGDGRTLALTMVHCPSATGVGIDFSEPMLAEARKKFAANGRVQLAQHDLSVPIEGSEFGCFDAVVSSLAIHHPTIAEKAPFQGNLQPSQFWRRVLQLGTRLFTDAQSA